jgi:hypothetical protein
VYCVAVTYKPDASNTCLHKGPALLLRHSQHRKPLVGDKLQLPLRRYKPERC